MIKYVIGCIFVLFTILVHAATIHDDLISGDVSRVQTALNQGIEVDYRYQGGFTALHSASDQGNFAVAKLLIESGADVNAVADDGSTALHTINVNAYLKNLNLFRNFSHERMVTVDESDGHIAVLKLLLSKGAKIDHRDSFGVTPLYLMTERGMIKIAEILILNGANPWIADKDYKVAPLHLMADQGYSQLVKLAFEKWSKASANILDSNGFSPLMRIGDSAFLDAKQSAELRAMSDGFAMLGDALDGKQVEEAETIIPAALINESHLETARILVKNGADVDAIQAIENGNNWSVLHFAAYRGAASLIKELIELGADPNAKLRSGHTVLDVAIENKQQEVIKILKQVNIQSK